MNTWPAGTTPPAALPSGRPSGGGLNLTRLALLLEDAHERLAGVVIENLDWPDFMARYDRPETLFYLDPPYWGSEGDYGRELFSRDQFATLAPALKELQGAFILSINASRRSESCSPGRSSRKWSCSIQSQEGRVGRRES